MRVPNYADGRHREINQTTLSSRGILRVVHEHVVAPAERCKQELLRWLATCTHLRRLAIDNWRDLDMKLVEAQEGRRVLDRLVGYEVSNVAFRVAIPAA